MKNGHMLSSRQQVAVWIGRSDVPFETDTLRRVIYDEWKVSRIGNFASHTDENGERVLLGKIQYLTIILERKVFGYIHLWHSIAGQCSCQTHAYIMVGLLVCNGDTLYGKGMDRQP